MVYFVSTIEKTLVEEVARLFQDNIWKLHGLPESIITDREVQFTVEMIKELNNMLGIDTKLLMAYYLQTNRQTKRINQDLEQYLRIFIEHRQEQWSNWLATVEFVYNNKVQTSTRVSLFKVNNEQDLYMELEIKKKRKFEKAVEFVTRIKKVHEEAEAALRKSQKKIQKYTDKKRSKSEEYKVENWVLLSTKDLKDQIQGRQSEKLIKQFVGPYKVKRIILTNTIKPELPSSIKIYPVVNISRVQKYRNQIEGQKKKQPLPVIIEGEEKYKVVKILNKRKFKERDRYLV